MPAEQSNERVKSYTIYACVEDDCGYYRDNLSTGRHVDSELKRHEIAPLEVIPASSPNVLSVEEARLIAAATTEMLAPEDRRAYAALCQRLEDFAEGGRPCLT